MGIRVYPDTPRIYFDMDGVLADFEKKKNELAITFDELKAMKGAYRSLDVMEGAKEAVREIMTLGHQTFILTKIPRNNPYSATEKILWQQEHFPEFDENIILSPDKGAVGREIDFLIDDYPEWANANNFRGTVLHFKRNWKEIIKQLRDNPSI